MRTDLAFSRSETRIQFIVSICVVIHICCHAVVQHVIIRTKFTHLPVERVDILCIDADTVCVYRYEPAYLFLIIRIRLMDKSINAIVHSIDIHAQLFDIVVGSINFCAQCRNPGCVHLYPVVDSRLICRISGVDE